MSSTAEQMTRKGRGVMLKLRRIVSRFSPDSLLARLILIFSVSFFVLIFRFSCHQAIRINEVIVSVIVKSFEHLGKYRE